MNDSSQGEIESHLKRSELYSLRETARPSLELMRKRKISRQTDAWWSVWN